MSSTTSEGQAYDVIDTSEAETTVNALVGPIREYKGKKNDENDFVIDSGRQPLNKYISLETRGFIERARNDRALREARQQQEELNETTGSKQRTKQEIEHIDPLGLGAIRNRLINPDSKMVELFFNTRWRNFEKFLVKFNERKASILKARESRPVLTSQESGEKDSKTDILEFEVQFEETILARIKFLTTSILTEFESVNYTRHRKLKLDDEFKFLPNDPERPPPTRRTPQASSDDDDDVDVDDSGEVPTPSRRNPKRRRGEEGEPPTPPPPRQRPASVARENLRTMMIRAIEQIDNLVGLVSVKRSLARLVIASLVVEDVDLFKNHRGILLFGQPGTGKTTVASRIENVVKMIGLIPEPINPSGKIASYDRSLLVAGFEGQTSIKTRQAFASRYGGMLFIDEVYTLRQGERDETGNESIDTIVKLTEDYKGEIWPAAAGYEDLIRERILKANEGFSSRFPYKWRLPNYTAQQLIHIVSEPRAQQIVANHFLGSRACLEVYFIGMRYDSSKKRDVDAVLVELIGRAWEKNLFEDTNARGAINLKRTIDEVRSQRIFLESRSGTIDRSSPTSLRDVLLAFVVWARAEKDVEVYYKDDDTRALLNLSFS